MKVMIIFGTRPEAIKMAPVVRELQASPEFEVVVCVTAQHRQMLDQVLALFEIVPQYDLNVMTENQDLASLTGRILTELQPVFRAEKPDLVLVHGDTTTTMASTLAAFYARIPVGHVEAGLRTFDKHYPFPEEINRVVTDAIADWHFAPTTGAEQNLLQTGAKEKTISVTGNTVIDALFYTLEQTTSETALPVVLDETKRLILVTTHRRENFGEPLVEICDALGYLVDQYPDVEIVLPVHPNPNVKHVVESRLAQKERIHLIPPQDYIPFCHLLKKSYLILTDSGGVQEEAPALGKPVLVLRDETERPEAVEAGCVKLVGPHFDAITAEADRLLTDEAYYQSMSRSISPYGDGQAAVRIRDVLEAYAHSKTSALTSQALA
jgi:UDP-N-acetylglucosamine 2-epimerase (non-hydrolysing)